MKHAIIYISLMVAACGEPTSGVCMRLADGKLFQVRPYGRIGNSATSDWQYRDHNGIERQIDERNSDQWQCSIQKPERAS